jgi:hypothetical protein
MTFDTADWKKSTRSGANGNCVEVALNLPGMPGYVGVRHSQRPNAEVILYTDAEWQAFVGGAADGEFTK